MTSADIMSTTRDSHLNQNKYAIPNSIPHYAIIGIVYAKVESLVVFSKKSSLCTIQTNVQKRKRALAFK